MNQLVITSDGSHTIFVPGLNEHYHSVHGAVQESEHIFINNGFDFCRANPVNIFEVGYGTGLNALLTAVKSMKGNKEVLYTAIEKYPVGEDVMQVLNHHLYAGEDGMKLSRLINSAPWGEMSDICNNFSIRKIIGDILTDDITGDYDLIYFDAFGPDKQPDMWTGDIFRKISGITRPGGIFVTYSAKGQVKRDLRTTGFEVTMLPGPPGKRHIIRAIKI